MRTLLLSITLLAGCLASPLPQLKLAGPVPPTYAQYPLEFAEDCTGADAAEPWCSESFSDDEYQPEAPASQPVRP